MLSVPKLAPLSKLYRYGPVPDGLPVPSLSIVTVIVLAASSQVYADALAEIANKLGSSTSMDIVSSHPLSEITVTL